MDILVCAMKEAGIINSGEVLFSKLLCDLLEVSEADAGIFSLFYSNIKDEYTWLQFRRYGFRGC